MPFARAPRLRLSPHAEAARPQFEGRPGHPVLVRVQSARRRLVTGDRGLTGALRTTLVPGTAENLFDVDTRADLRRARRWLATRVG
jgi:CTP:molybdopterin cytidylyltransferase MocA